MKRLNRRITILTNVALLLIFTAVFAVSFLPQTIVPIYGGDQVSAIYNGNREKPNVSLMFNVYENTEIVNAIVDTLDEYNVKATFFIIGINAKNYPEALSRVIDAGHEIGNHSYDHSNEKNFGREYAESEILKCEELIYKETGIIPRLFRPPQGQYSCDVEKIVNEKNYSIILWSIDTRDWEHTPPERIKNIIDKNLSGGDIILMHDYTSGKNTTCDALELIIPSLLSRGYEFVTVSELMQLP